MHEGINVTVSLLCVRTLDVAIWLALEIYAFLLSVLGTSRTHHCCKEMEHSSSCKLAGKAAELQSSTSRHFLPGP